ncbi:MAG TPA: sigma 54-interacting transcriptional regulator [Methylomirabilota bacterium]|nr:sigma 54-interacting transcriptional regulator [Methylomirabilota bacterium]
MADSTSLHPTDRILGNATAMAELRAQIRHLATFDTVGSPHVPTLLLQGETGTGKGLLARVIHDSGPRAHGPFVDVNCAAIPEHLLEAELFGFDVGAFTDAKRAKPGLFESASGGTLFLDEIEALPMTLQGKLLRSIEDKRVRRLGAVTEHAVDVKVVAAAQRQLHEAVAEKRFRPDLYHRLAVVVVQIPPLRERSDDIVLLAKYFLNVYASAHGLATKQLAPDAQTWLWTYDWPGNVRELAHLMERITLLVPEPVVVAHVLKRLLVTHPRLAGPSVPETSVPSIVGGDEEQIRAAIARTHGNVVRAARLLGLSRNAFRYRMLRYGIERRPTAHADGPAERHAEVSENDSGGAVHVHVDGAEPTWEKKLVAVATIHLTFPRTADIDAAHPQPWTLAKRWEQILTDKVHGFGGILLNSSPCLFTALFGIPHTLEQMAVRALHAALAIRHAVAETATVDSPELRAAVHLGDVLLDLRPPFIPARLLAVGDTLAYPIRLLGQAAAGEVAVSSAVQRVVARDCSLVAREIVVELGGASPDRAYIVTSIRPVGAHRTSRFVGRERELAELSRMLDHVSQGRGQVVAIVGEAGVGKSRLRHEFTEAVRASCLVVEAVSSPGQSHAFVPLIEMLKRYFAIDARDDKRMRREKVTERVLTLDKHLEETLPYLLPLLDVVDPRSTLAQMDPAARRRRTFDAVKALLLRESLNQPILVVVEDLHGIDDETLGFLDVLVDAVPEARVLLLVTYRPEHGHGWSGKTYYTQLRLDPLDAKQADEMTAALVGEAPDLKELVVRKAQGNPLFIEEIARALLDGGPDAFELPPTIQGVLAARVDQLAKDERALLQTLAVLGHEFPLTLVQNVWDGTADELRVLLARLQASEFIRERPALPETTYSFKHALTRDVAYTALDPELRRRVHVRAAEATETLFADGLDDHYHVLAHHAQRAGLTSKAVDYLGLAGRQAVQRSAYAEAIAHFRSSLALLSSLPPGRERNQRELGVQTSLGAALMATEGMGAPQVEEVFQRARELCREVGETPQLFRVLQGLSVFYALRVKLRTSEELADERRRLAERLENPALVLQAQIARGHVLLALGELPAARAELERAAGLYDPRQHHALAFGGVDPSGRDHAAIVLWLLGYPDKALASMRQMLAIAREQPHPFTLTVAQLFAAMLHQLRRESGLTREWAEAATVLTTRHAFAMWRAMALVLSGWAFAAEGDTSEGILRMRRGIDDWRATGAELLRPYFLGLLAEALAYSGGHDEGLLLLGEALDIVRRTEQHWCEADLLRLQGDVLLAAAREREAAASLDAALGLARRQEAKSLELRAAMSLSRLLQRRGDYDEAQTLLAGVHGWFSEGFDTPDLRQAATLLR